MKLYGDRPNQILPSPVIQSYPSKEAQEISVNVELRTLEPDARSKKYHQPTIKQRGTNQRVIACIVFTL
jgi:hypothetical protein